MKKLIMASAVPAPVRSALADPGNKIRTWSRQSAVVDNKTVIYMSSAHSLVLAFPSSLLAMAPIGLCVAIGASRTLLKAFA